MQSCPEIFASGFRNPWRWSFDRATGAFWVGDVGQGAREEVDRVVLGGNYGWRCFEGTQSTGFACGGGQAFLPPVAEYGRSEGATVIGGYVYRGSAMPGLVGRYVFGDFISGRVWHIDANAAPTVTMTGGLATGLQISSFAEGVDGELYLVDYAGGLYRLVSR
jgi:glucose/arabinose dehydrogenase